MTKNARNVEFDVEFGKVLRKKRFEMDISTKDTCAHMHISESTLAKWEQGDIAIRVADAFKLCKYIEIRWIDILRLWEEHG